MTTINQINANKENSLLSTGPITEEGKEKIRYNALTHGILQKDLTPYEEISIDELKNVLLEEESPVTTIEHLLLERIALHIIRLKRIVKAESEYIRATLDPTIVEDFIPVIPSLQPKIKHQGYTPFLLPENIETIVNIYSRYETYEENKLYRAIREYKNLKIINHN